MPAVFQPSVPVNQAIFNACDSLCLMAGTERPIAGFDSLTQIEKKGCAAIVAIQQSGGFIPTPAAVQAIIDASIALFALTLSEVAFTGQYGDLLGLPVIPALPTAQTLQVGSVPFIAGQQKYLVNFSAPMSGIPKIKTQVLMANDNGEVFFATLTDEGITASHFNFWLNGSPSTSTGRLEYTAKIESTP